MTLSASLRSPVRRTSVEARSASSTLRAITSTWSRSCSRSAAKAVRNELEDLAEASCDVVLCPFVTRVGEDEFGLVVLHQNAGSTILLLVDLRREERRHVTDSRGLLHVVGHDHDRVLKF